MTDFKVKAWYRDPDAIVLFALAVVLVALPPEAFGQVVERIQNPFVASLIAAGPLGRFGVRAAGVVAAGRAVASGNQPDTLVVQAGEVDLDDRDLDDLAGA